MSFTKKLEFGNYTLKFGEDKVLLDLFSEVVMPSFHEMKYIRKIKGKGEYFFLDTELLVLDSSTQIPVLGITGRIVKNTKLKREQIYSSNGGLIDDRKELESAPSSTFLLILNNHRLILCREVPGAPTIQNFQSTSQFCLSQQYKAFLQAEYERAQKEPEDKTTKTTKKHLREVYPRPYLRVTPLSDKQSLKDFVGRLKHIDDLSIKLLPTNDEEINNDDFWADFGRRREEMNSNAAKVTFSNTKEGLDGNKVYEQANAASGLGNSEVKLKGYDRQGDTIKGSNDDFSLTVEMESMSRNVKRAAIAKFNQFQQLASQGVIKIPTLAQTTIDKVVSIFRSI